MGIAAVRPESMGGNLCHWRQIRHEIWTQNWGAESLNVFTQSISHVCKYSRYDLLLWNRVSENTNVRALPYFYIL